MFNRWILVIVLLISFVYSSKAQNRSFYKRLDAVRQDSIHFETWKPKENRMVVNNFMDRHYEGMIIGGINDYRQQKRRDQFEQSYQLAQMCEVALKVFQKSYFTKRKYRERVVRYIHFGLRYLQCSHRMFKVIVFKTRLADLNKKQKFYYDRKNDASELHLYYGEKRIKELNNGEEVKPEPVLALTEKVFFDEVARWIKSKGGNRLLMDRGYNQIGLKFKLDETSVNRKKIPMVYGIVLIAGKHSDFLPDLEFTPSSADTVSRSNPYILLR